MFGRIAVAIALGMSVTAGLLFVMQLMVATGRSAITDAPRFRVAEFVRVEREETVRMKERKPERPPEPESVPERPRPDAGDAYSADLAVSVSAPPVAFNASTNHLGFGISDGELLPIVKVAPVYPTRALAKRLEGYVLVEFIVTATGAVKDVVVLESTADLFEKPAIEAALKFRYKPRVVDGVAVEVRGVRNRILFEMQAQACAEC
jgi:periplasmic protein TonB